VEPLHLPEPFSVMDSCSSIAHSFSDFRLPVLVEEAEKALAFSLNFPIFGVQHCRGSSTILKQEFRVDMDWSQWKDTSKMLAWLIQIEAETYLWIVWNCTGVQDGWWTINCLDDLAWDL
jgi:hypothetical protein